MCNTMKIIYKDKIPILEIENYQIKGWKDIPNNYANKNAIVFTNNFETSTSEIEDYLEKNLYELLKTYTISDFPDKRIEIIIESIRSDFEPEILQKLPYPFTGLKIGVFENEFIITFDLIQDTEYYDDKWDKKWTNEFYFDNFSRILKNENNLEIIYEKDDYISLQLSMKIQSKNIEEAVQNSIIRVKDIIQKVESSISGISGFFEVIEIWNNKKVNKSEIFWHNLLKQYSWLLSLIINEPVIIVEDEAYIGGKSIQNKKGNVIDFIYQNKLSENLALIEIKTPQTKIIGKQYRNTFSLSNEIIGSINQLLSYKDHFQKNFYTLNSTSNINFKLISPSSYLIIGNQENLSYEQKECFELFRKNLNGISIITFDELFEKAFYILTMMNK